VTSAAQRPAWNLLTGTLTCYVLLGVTIVLGIFLMPFTMRHLGQANYGVWMLAASMTAYFQLLDLGYGSGLVRQITQADARGDEDEINVVLSTAMVVYTVVGLVTLVATAALTVLVIPRFPKLSHDQVRTAQWILAILGARMAIAFPMSVFGAINTARQRFALTGSIAIVVALIQGAVTFVVLNAGYGVVTLVAATTALGIASFVVYAAAARQTFPGMRLSPSRFSVRHVRDVTSFSLYLFLISVAYHLATNIDNLIIGAYVGTAAIAIYTVAVRLSEYQREFCGKFTGFLFPLVVRFHETQDAGALRATLVDGTRIALALVACVTLGLIAFGRGLIHIWMGTGFEATVMPLYVLALAGVVMVAQGPTGTILLGTGRHRLVAFASVAEISANAILSIALVHRFGLTGVAVGTAVPFAIINLFVLMPAACRTVGLSIRTFAFETAVPTIVGLVPAIAVSAALRLGGEAASVPVLTVQSVMVGLTYGMAFWAIGLRAGDRVRYAASIRQLFTAMPATPRVVTP
jgi:O-antigen/teichoic acid export membrane protein